MADKAKQEEVRCPNCRTSRIRLRGVHNAWEHTFEMGRGDPASSGLRGRVLTYWCDECQKAFSLVKQ